MTSTDFDEANLTPALLATLEHDHRSMMICSTDEHTPILWASKTWTEMTGYELKDGLGKNPNFLQLKTGETGTKTEVQACARNKGICSEIKAHIAANEPFHATVCNYKKDGKCMWTELSACLFTGLDDKQYWVCLGADVTDKKKRDDNMALFTKTMAATAVVGVMAWVYLSAIPHLF